MGLACVVVGGVVLVVGAVSATIILATDAWGLRTKSVNFLNEEYIKLVNSLNEGYIEVDEDIEKLYAACTSWLASQRTQTQQDPDPNVTPTPGIDIWLATPYPTLAAPTATPDNQQNKIYQFADQPGTEIFQNGPAADDFDGVSVALADKCGTPAACLSAMFNDRLPTPNDYYRESTMSELTSRGFIVFDNGGDPISGQPGQSYPLPHASVTHPNQNYRDNGAPQWGKGTKRSFSGAFSEPRLVLSQ